MPPLNMRRGLGRCAWLLALVLPAAAQQAPPEGPDVLYQRGVNAFSAGDYPLAVSSFQNLLDRFGKEPSLAEELEGVNYAIGCALYNSGQYEECAKAFDRYLAQYPRARYRDEALFRIAAAWQIKESYDTAVAAYQRLLDQAPDSPYAEDAAYQIGACWLLRDLYDKAAAAFAQFRERFPDSELYPQAAIYQARCLFETGKLPEALDVFTALNGRRKGWEHIAYLNLLAVEIGDAAFDNTQYDLALRAYRWVRTRQTLLRMERQTIAGLQAQLEELMKPTLDPRALADRFRRERRLRNALAMAQELMQKLEAAPDYDATLFHRIGRCYSNIDRLWEACVAFQRVVREAQDEKIREAAHFDLVLTLARMRRFDDVIEEATRYLARYE